MNTSNVENNELQNIDNKQDKPKITNGSDKYKVLLKFVNKILVNIDKEEIDDLTKFINIDREDIIKDVNIKALNEMAPELFVHYNKQSSRFYNKSNAYTLNCLRGLLKEAGFKFTYVSKEVYEDFNGKSARRSHILYSIK